VRVLQVHTRYREAGGEDVVVAAEAALLREAGHEVVQWTSENPAGGLAAFKALIQAPANKRAAAAVSRAAVKARPDVVHVHNTWYATSPAVFGALQRVVDGPVVMTLHNYRLACANGLLQRDGVPCELCVGTGPWKAVRYGCYRDSRVLSVPAAATISINRRRGTWSSAVDRFLVLTEFARSRAVATGLPTAKLEVKHNFVTDQGPRAKAAEESNRVLFVGRILPGKGINTLLEAWQRSAPDGLELVIAGDGPAFGELSSRQRPGVRLLGRIDRAAVQKLMFESRALMFPSKYYEGMPMTLLESFASGLPVIGSDRGSITEMLSPFGEDWLVAADSVDAWAAKLSLLTDDGAVADASATARRLWDESYGPERALRNLEHAYRT